MVSAITDNLGRHYLPVVTMTPGGTLGDTKVRDFMKFGRDRVEILEWVPSEPTSNWTSARSFDFTAKYPWEATAQSQVGEYQTHMQIPAPTPITTHFPAYSSAIFLDYEHVHFEMSASEARAMEAERKHDYAKASRWYFDAAKNAPVPGWKRRFESKAVRCQKQVAPHSAP
jgi:hypothetical protein